MTNANNNRRSFLSKVMKAAWTIYRKGAKTFSQSLKRAWKWAKKNLVQQQQVNDMIVPVDKVGEKGKGTQFSGYAECHGGLGRTFTFWMPTSAIKEVSNAGVIFHSWALGMLEEKTSKIPGFIAFAE